MRRLRQQLSSPVGTPIVHEDDLVRTFRQRVDHLQQPCQQLGKHLFLVVKGYAYREAHGLVLPSKYTIDQRPPPYTYGSTETGSKCAMNNSRHAASGRANRPRSSLAITVAIDGRSGRTSSSMCTVPSESSSFWSCRRIRRTASSGR